MENNKMADNMVHEQVDDSSSNSKPTVKSTAMVGEDPRARPDSAEPGSKSSQLDDPDRRVSSPPTQSPSSPLTTRPSPRPNASEVVSSSLLIDDGDGSKSCDTEVADKRNDTNNNKEEEDDELVQQEGYIAMSENGEHCVFIPAEQVEEEMIQQATATDGTVLLTPKQENEGNVVINNFRSEQHQMEHHFTNQQQLNEREMPALAPLSKQGQATRLHQEGNAMMMNFHHAQSVSVADQTSQIPVHNQLYNPSSGAPHHFSPRRINQQQQQQIMEQMPYPTHVQQTRAAYQKAMYAPQEQVQFNDGSAMSNYTHLPPVSSLRPTTVIENQTLHHPMHQQTTVIAGSGDSVVINSSPAKETLGYSHQYLMKAPAMTSISPLKTDTVIQDNDQMQRTQEHNVGRLYRMDGRPSQGLVQQVLQVFRNSKKREMQPCEVYFELAQLYPLYTTYTGQKKKSWMSSVRHALTHPAFKSRRADDNNECESHRKGCFWSVKDNYDPHGPLPRRRRKVQRKMNYGNNQMQYMMMPVAVSNEQMMGPQSTFNPMMSGNVMPAYIMPQNNNGLPHMFGDINTNRHPAMNIMQPQPMMVPPFGNATNNNSNLVNYGQFGGNYQNLGNTFMGQMKAAGSPIKKLNYNVTSNTQISQQPRGLYPYFHRDNVEKVQLKSESEVKPAGVYDKRDENQLQLASQPNMAERNPSQSIASIAEEPIETNDGNDQQASSNNSMQPSTERIQPADQQS